MIIALVSDAVTKPYIFPAFLAHAMQAVQKIDLRTIEPGRHELDGDKLFLLIQDVETRTFEESKSEVHGKYADIQMPLTATERYGYALPQTGLVAIEDFLEARDCAFYKDVKNESFVDVEPGSFVFFAPGELHRACLSVGEKSKLRKAVIKIHSSLFGV